MATAKVILNTSYQSKDGSYPVVIRLINGKKQRLHPTGEKIKETFWLGDRVDKKHPEAHRINNIIDIELSKAKTYFAQCKIKNIPIDLDLVFSEIKSHSFTGYLQHRVKQHALSDQLEMQIKLSRFIKELDKCFGREIYFSEVNQDFLRTFDTFLKNIPNSDNTRSKKFETLSKYYNNAITDKKATGPNPFKEYKIKTTPVKKEKLTTEQVKAIEELPLKDGPVRFARDLFLFSYYCKGIRFETCITMAKTAVIAGRLHFQINKGKRHMSAVIHPKLQAIIERYIDNPTDTIFGRFNLSDINTRAKKRSKLGSENSMINLNLKEVARLLEIPIELSVHHARHSFAFHLKKKSKSIHVISDSLGHSRSNITEVYLKVLDDEYLDEQLSGMYD